MSLLRADRIANRYNNTGPIIVGPSTVHGDFTITGNLIVAGIAVTNGVTVGGALTANTLKATNLVESVYGNITGVATINTIRGATYFGVGNNITGVTTLIKEGSGIVVLSGTPQDGGFTNNVTLSARNVVESQFATEAGVSTNLVGGDAGKIPYQTAADTTGFTDVGTAGQILQSQGAAKPTWTSLAAINVAYADSAGISTDLYGGSAGRLVYQSGIDQTAFVPVGSSGRVLVAQGSLSPTWVDPNVGLSVSFAKFAGLSTNVSGGIASVTQLNVGPGISTFNGPLLAQGNINVTGVTTTVDLRVSSAATINNLTLQTGPGVAVTAILDEDTFVSDRDDALATQQSIKAYVDSQVTAQDLDVSTDDGTIAIDLDSEVLGINGASNEIYITATGNDVTVGLNTDVTISNDLTVTGNAGIGSLNVTGITTLETLGVTGVETVQFLNVTGFSTITHLGVTGVTTTQNIEVAGISTLNRLTVSGISTFTNDVVIGAGNTVYNGDFNNSNFTGLTTVSTLEVTGGATAQFVEVTGIATISTLDVTGVAEIQSLEVIGITTVSDISVTGNAGIGSLNVTGITTLETLGVTGVATIQFAEVTGIATISTLGVSNDLTVTGNAGIGSLNVTGITTLETLGVTGVTTSEYLVVTGLSTFTNGPVFIGTDTSTGDSNQLLQINGDGYITGNLGIGETQPVGVATTTNTSILNVGVVTANFFYGDGSKLTNVEGFPDIDNLLYVAKNGDDTNPGTRLSAAKRTVGAALTLATTGTVIKISAGTYEENNPLKIPAQVSLIGDSLRDTTIIPINSDQDLFHVKGGDYISDMSFTGTMDSDKAVIAFDPDSPDYIIQSPYVRNCTNFINESIGMKIDGADAIGRIKSMVVDSYTQYNQGGIGVSITNEGYAQLVSIFTICSETAIYCGAGGACDLTNSNSSFGDYGLIAEGVGPRNFTGVVTESASENSSQFVLDVTPTTLTVNNADYDNVSGLVTFTTTTDHNLVVGTAVTVKDLKFTCDSFNPVTSFGISTANYDNVSGIMTVQTNTDHNFVVGLAVTFNGLVFECDSGGGLSTAIFPPAPGDGNGPANHVFDVVTVGTSTQFSVLVGPSTIAHGYVDSGNVAISTISTFPSGTYGNIFVVEDVVGPQSFSAYVGVSSFVHSYDSGGEIEEYITRPYDGQVIYFGELYYTVNDITITNRGSGYTSGPPTVTIDSPSEDWGITATATASVVGGIVDEIDIVSTGRGYTSTPPTVTFSAPAVGINTAEGTANLLPTYYVISESTPISNGICTVTVTENVPFAVGVGTTTPFFKQSRILASSHSFEYIGSGTSLNTALPQDGGVAIQENEIVERNGGLVIYTSTDQAGNFRIGDGVIINQQTGTITGDDYTRSLFATMTPFILALGGD